MTTYNPITSAEIAVDQPVSQELMQKIKDGLDHFNSKIGSLVAGDIANGSFDIDADADDYPDNWDINLYPGGVAGLSPSVVLGTDGLPYTCILAHTAAAANKPITGANWATYWAQRGENGAPWVEGKAYKTVSAHGSRCLYFIHPGGTDNGGGYATSDYYPCTESEALILRFLLLATAAANLRVKVEALFYDKDKIYLSSSTLLNTTTPPTSLTPYQLRTTTAANTRFMKVRVTGGYTDTDPVTAQLVYFDGVSVGKEELHMASSSNWSNNDSWYQTVPKGMWNIALQAMTGSYYQALEINVGGTWYTIAKSDSSGGRGAFVISDGTNVRLNVSNSGTSYVYYQQFHSLSWEG